MHAVVVCAVCGIVARVHAYYTCYVFLGYKVWLVGELILPPHGSQTMVTNVKNNVKAEAVLQRTADAAIFGHNAIVCWPKVCR